MVPYGYDECYPINDVFTQYDPNTGTSKKSPVTGAKTCNSENVVTLPTPEQNNDSELLPTQVDQENAENQSGEIPPNQRDDVCNDYRHGKCKHGIKCQKIVEGNKCPKFHPKRCFKYCKYGSRSKNQRGCDKGNLCEFYHPILCRYVNRNHGCTKNDCTYAHLRIAKKIQKPDTQSHPKHRKTNNPREQHTYVPETFNRRQNSDPPNQPPKRGPRFKESQKPRHLMSNLISQQHMNPSYQSDFHTALQSLREEFRQEIHNTLKLLMPHTQHPAPNQQSHWPVPKNQAVHFQIPTAVQNATYQPTQFPLNHPPHTPWNQVPQASAQFTS